MDLTSLQSIISKQKKRVGRGYGSGKAKTAGRGTKGQLARGTTRPGFEGGQLPLIKRLPFRRGLGNTSHYVKPLAINAVRLSAIPAGTTINQEALVKHGLVPASYRGEIKVIGLTGKEAYKFDGILFTKSAKVGKTAEK
jgi:large subunit ribosomal protein L15